MAFRIDPIQSDDPGIDIPLPGDLQKGISSWADITYKQYPFGTILTQKVIEKRFQASIFLFAFDKSTSLYSQFDAGGVALFSILKGNYIKYLPDRNEEVPVKEGTAIVSYFPEGIHELRFIPGTVEMMLLIPTTSLFEELAEGHPILQELSMKLKEEYNRSYPLRPVHISFTAMTILDTIRHTIKKDNSFHIDFILCIASLLREYAAQLSNPSFDENVDPHQTQTLMEIYIDILNKPNIHHHSTNQLVRKYNISEGTLRRNFLSAFNLSPHEFVWKQCMLRAKQLLTTTNMPTEAIAEEFGYSSTSNFDRAYKHFHKKLPGEERGS